MSKQLQELVARRILILDGAMGTMIQQLNFGEAEFRAREFADHPRDLKGCNDLLSITQPEAIIGIHRGFLEAGADIISTNTFNANAISMADYGLVERVREINTAAVACAKKAIEQFCSTAGQARHRPEVGRGTQDSVSGQWAVGGGQNQSRVQGSGFGVQESSPHPLPLSQRERGDMHSLSRPTCGPPEADPVREIIKLTGARRFFASLRMTGFLLPGR